MVDPPQTKQKLCFPPSPARSMAVDGKLAIESKQTGKSVCGVIALTPPSGALCDETQSKS